MATPTAGAVTHAPTPQARNRLLRWLVPIGLGVIILLIPKPAGLTPAAWHYFALFVMVISGLITEPIPGPALGFMGVSAGAALILVGKTPTESMRWALSGFSNDTVWLIFAATMFAAGYEATGLGRRIALLLVKALGRKTLGLGYAIAIADLVLAPFMPSNTARSGGTIFPVVKNIPGLYGSSPTDHPRKIGAYLCWTAFATTCVTSAMFVTGHGAEPAGMRAGQENCPCGRDLDGLDDGLFTGGPIDVCTDAAAGLPDLSAGNQRRRRGRQVGRRGTDGDGADFPAGDHHGCAGRAGAAWPGSSAPTISQR